ncbi:MAG: alpha/beta hydrolase [Myxococcales bacterium]|nr:MAG: alpha/beta hydrolase [Myxococcales bacterium]
MTDKIETRNSISSRIYRGVTYNSQSPQQKLDIYLPTDSSDMRLPALLWVHGGGWAGGSRLSESEFALRQLERGYVVVGVGYRLSWEAPYPAALVDVRNAVRFLKKNASDYHIDPNHIAIWGASAGGHLAALVGTTGHMDNAAVGDYVGISSEVQAVIDWWGPSDFLAMSHQWPARCKSHRDSTAASSPESRLLECPVLECPDAARAANPITYLSAKTPPFLIMAGDSDCTVPPKQSELLWAALKRHHVSVEFALIKGAEHGGPRWYDPAVQAKVDTFLDRYLPSPWLSAISASP